MMVKGYTSMHKELHLEAQKHLASPKGPSVPGNLQGGPSHTCKALPMSPWEVVFFSFLFMFVRRLLIPYPSAESERSDTTLNYHGHIKTHGITARHITGELIQVHTQHTLQV